MGSGLLLAFGADQAQMISIFNRIIEGEIPSASRFFPFGWWSIIGPERIRFGVLLPSSL
jgi:hypothetical protein